MTRKLSNIALAAVLMCGLSLVAASCSDSNKELSEEEKEQQAEQQTDQDMADAATFWQVVGQLTDDVMPDDWQNATYAPAIGDADGTDNTVRIVNTSDIETAAERFSQLTGSSVTASTTTYTYQNDLVGTLTYRQTGGASLATVDVDIKQMPGLKQIVYKTPEQIADGANGSFDGTAYYRFGDVVRKQNVDGLWDYWICVRPAFGPASKGDSHWITLSKLPSPYVKTVNKTVNRVRLTHIMPKSLGTNREHMQNMAELLYAMTHSETWAANLATNNGYKTLKYFKDFDYKKVYQYNNAAYFSSVCQGMPDATFQEIFGLSKQQMAAELEEDGLHLVYNTATMTGNNISLNVAKYSGTNLKTETLYKQTTTHDTEAFDIYAMTKNHYITAVTADEGSFKMWVCRYATGATLAKGSRETPATFDKYRRLPNCEDVFVYNRDVANLDVANLRNIAPQITDAANNDQCYYHCGDIIRYQDRFYVCVETPTFGGTARFITLNDQATHTTKEFPWSEYDIPGKDVVYNDDMASAETVTKWIANILMDDDMCENVAARMADHHPNDVRQVAPEDEEIRKNLVKILFDEDHIITNVHMGSAVGAANEHITPYTWDYLYEKDANDPTDADVILYAPVDCMLADRMRYSTSLTGHTQHWVPYLICFKEGNTYQNNLLGQLNEAEQCQVTSHFTWKDMGLFEYKGDKLSDIATRPYHIVKVAMYWVHKMLGNKDYTHFPVIDFTKDYRNHPKQAIRNEAAESPNRWTWMNVTSRELTFTEDGKKKNQYESVWVKKEQ